MASLPRVITVDPTGTIARVVDSAVRLLDSDLIQIHVPTGTDALEEVQRGGVALALVSWELLDDLGAPLLAIKIKQSSPGTGVIVLADVDGPESLDEETAGEPPFLYMRRPVDVHQFFRVFYAALSGQNMFQALETPAAMIEAVDRGPVPKIDPENSQRITKRLLADVGAMAIILTTRAGDIIVEQGALGYLNREKLASALLPLVTTNVEMSELIGGQPQSLQFFDGDDKDIFVFSVGIHYFLCIVFDGQAGSRQFGVVNTYGRRAVQDLIALLGASAFMMQTPVVAEAAPAAAQERKPLRSKVKTSETEAIEPVLVRPEVKVPEPEPMRLDPIQNLDLSIFDQLGNLDTSMADDLFDPDKLADMVNKATGRKEVSFDEAIELGVLPDIDGDKK
jgi:hypothetical protein